MTMTAQGKARTETLVISLHKAVFALDRTVDRLLAERFDLTFSQFFILRVLVKRPGTTQKAIAGARGLTEPAVSRTIELLLRKGLVGRRVNPGNRRERLLVLTKKGSSTEARARRAALGKVEKPLRTLSAAERKTLGSALDKLMIAFGRGRGEESRSFEKN